MNNTVLVTGGAGFIGSNFVLNWIAKTKAGVVNLDLLTYAGNRRNLLSIESDPRHVFVKGDIGDGALVGSLLEKYKPRAILHFAAESHVDRSIAGPGAFIQTNIVGTFSLLEQAKVYWSELGAEDKTAFRFLHVSTDEVYGTLEANDPAFTEETPYTPNSPYAASKASSDHLVRAYFHTYGFPVLTTNCSNNYGPYQFPEKLIPLTIVNILLGRPLPVYGDGLQVRDWLHVEDHCAAILQALTEGAPGEVYNIGGNSETTNIEIVRTLCALVDAYLAEHAELRGAFAASPAANGKCSVDLISHVRDRPGHDRRYAINYAKAAKDLRYAPGRDLTQGLRATLQWYIDNTGWWQALMGRDYSAWLQKNYSR
jgi:dTDP-glucose 4,6-dehydratase